MATLSTLKSMNVASLYHVAFFISYSRTWRDVQGMHLCALPASMTLIHCKEYLPVVPISDEAGCRLSSGLVQNYKLPCEFQTFAKIFHSSRKVLLSTKRKRKKQVIIGFMPDAKTGSAKKIAATKQFLPLPPFFQECPNCGRVCLNACCPPLPCLITGFPHCFAFTG